MIDADVDSNIKENEAIYAQFCPTNERDAIIHSAAHHTSLTDIGDKLSQRTKKTLF